MILIPVKWLTELRFKILLKIDYIKGTLSSQSVASTKKIKIKAGKKS